MPYVNVHIDAEDVIEDLTDKQLRDELARRARKKDGGHGHFADYMIPVPAARDALDRAADFLRKHDRMDLAFKLEEVRVDYVEH